MNDLLVNGFILRKKGKLIKMITKEKIDKLESLVLQVSRILGMLLMLFVILALAINMLSYIFSKISPIFNQKYPKIVFEVSDFVKSAPSSSSTTSSEEQVDTSYTGKLADKILSKLEKDYISTIDNLVRTKGLSIIRGQLGDEFKSLRQAELDEQLDAVIKDTAPKYWLMFKDKSRVTLKNELNRFDDENFQDDFADKLTDYLVEAKKNSVSPYSLYNYKGDEVDFITDIKFSIIYKRFVDSYRYEKSNLESKNVTEEFFTTSRLTFIGVSVFILLFSGVLFSIMRIEKHLSKKA